MIAKPSIAFNDFSGTAKDVTARNVSGRNILSVRSKLSRIISPAQAATRNNLSRISRAYKQLSDSQISAWETLAVHFTSKSTLGSTTPLTAHNVFVKLNSSRVLAGFSIMYDAPTYNGSIPSVEYSDLWISPKIITFTGIKTPASTYKLVLKMSAAKSPGTGSKSTSMVIITPGISPDWGDADVTTLYTKTLGITPVEGMTYYAEFWWLDTKTGISGPSTIIHSRCQSESVINNVAYTSRNIIRKEDVKVDSTASLDNLAVELSPGSIFISTEAEFEVFGNSSGIGGEIDKIPENYPNINCYLMARTIDSKQGIYRVSLNSMYVYPSSKSWRFNQRYGSLWRKAEVFDVSLN